MTKDEINKIKIDLVSEGYEKIKIESKRDGGDGIEEVITKLVDDVFAAGCEAGKLPHIEPCKDKTCCN